MFTAFFFFGLSLATKNNAYAQPQSEAVEAPDDRSVVVVRRPENEQLRSFRADGDYRYDRDVPPPENPLARFLSWFWQKVVQILNSEAYQSIGQYIVLAGIAAFVIYLLRKAEMLNFLFPKKTQIAELPYEGVTENIYEINFDTAIEEAITRQDFRLAVRLMYLQTLKYLDEAGQINYQPDKTNRQYVYELANSPQQDEFETLTRQFEFVWYGDFPVDDALFSVVKAKFTTFNQVVRHL
ncbi:hypothetical protein AWR27_23785 [Spirosoma montaniterrae]|uniref:Protein-glutamine gamma-glutamyltransferase-like C-terminal domain-containing protein n=1 Tax=Spirosoma montaniterrae TaxID=1178516 RepID=A0A1P9X372_9BACT|nr:hypothetical protein AWR27_23785 [Spirosoma montaniterrae]